MSRGPFKSTCFSPMIKDTSYHEGRGFLQYDNASHLQHIMILQYLCQWFQNVSGRDPEREIRQPKVVKIAELEAHNASLDRLFSQLVYIRWRCPAATRSRAQLHCLSLCFILCSLRQVCVYVCLRLIYCTLYRGRTINNLTTKC